MNQRHRILSHRLTSLLELTLCIQSVFFFSRISLISESQPHNEDLYSKREIFILTTKNRFSHISFHGSCSVLFLSRRIKNISHTNLCQYLIFCTCHLLSWQTWLGFFCVLFYLLCTYTHNQRVSSSLFTSIFGMCVTSNCRWEKCNNNISQYCNVIHIDNIMLQLFDNDSLTGRWMDGWMVHHL